MYSAFALLALAFTGIASALPTIQKRDPPTSPGCVGLGGGAFDNISSFTLAAYNKTLPNANSTGAPLVLGQAGAIVGASFKVLSTYASYPYDDYPGLTMVNGGIVRGDSLVGTNITAGRFPGFILTGIDLPPPAQIYCGLASTSAHGGGTGFPKLAAFGDTESWSLCPNGNGPFKQVNVVYKATPDNFGSYIYDQCYAVDLQIIEN
ncbi:hypothetical protein NLI96_g1686 [Meripilus lineatus]|uniref:Uncharacterized protein n=1 Tax=Meripilus lineatus TaxID=2056292 RepID=A0AAD5VAC8_9APHY|nr:hypothetical protein NLI96_g1686 [Physisporinus lineatus]